MESVAGTDFARKSPTPRREKRAAELEAEVAKWLSAAAAANATEDKLHGGDKAGEERRLRHRSRP